MSHEQPNPTPNSSYNQDIYQHTTAPEDQKPFKIIAVLGATLIIFVIAIFSWFILNFATNFARDYRLLDTLTLTRALVTDPSAFTNYPTSTPISTTANSNQLAPPVLKPGLTLQEFTFAQCQDFPTPTGTDYLWVGVLIDERDGKSYVVKKFADGNCWLTTDLAYGDCSETSWVPNDTQTCRNSPYQNGFLYTYDLAKEVCPAGWRLPTGSIKGEYGQLTQLVGEQTSRFWFSDGWNGSLLRSSDSQGNVNLANDDGWYWTSTLFTPSGTHHSAYAFTLKPGYVSLGSGIDTTTGAGVRCLKDKIDGLATNTQTASIPINTNPASSSPITLSATTLQAFTAADCAQFPTPAKTGYTMVATLKDERDGNEYEVRKFADGHCWLVDNMRYDVGECGNTTWFFAVQNGQDSSTLCKLVPGLSSNGHLYNAQAAQQVCPTTWRIPSHQEWQSLLTATTQTSFPSLWKGVYINYLLPSGDGDDPWSDTARYWALDDQKHISQFAELKNGQWGITIGNVQANYGLSIRCISGK